MPFTFSHPAIILPFNYLPKRWISLTGLVIGSMTPDFEYFIRMRDVSHYTHTIPGIFWFDLPLALLLFLIYNKLVKNKLIDHLPAALNTRLSKFKNIPADPNRVRRTFVLLICIVIGISSHVLWDSFTHIYGYFVKDSNFMLREIYIMHFKFSVYNILQYISSIFGLVFIILTIWKIPAAKSNFTPLIIYYWLKIIVVLIMILALKIFFNHGMPNYADLIMTVISGGLIGIIIASLLAPASTFSKSGSDL